MYTNNLEKKEYNFKKLALVTLVGSLIAGFSMPGYGLGFLAWIALIPLFFALKNARNILHSCGLAFLFGFSFNAIVIFWVFHIWTMSWAGLSTLATYAIGVSVLFCLSLYTGWFFALYGILAKIILNTRLHNFFKIILLAALWVLINNKLLSLGELAFPWSMVEYSQYKYLHLIQIVQIIKGVGLEFIIVFVNLFILYFVFEKTENKTVKFYPIRLSLVIFLFLGLLLYGEYSLKKTSEQKNITVTLAQTNSNMNELGTSSQWKADYYQTIKNAPEGLVIFPEVASNEQIKTYNKRFITAVQKIIGDKAVIMGVWGFGYNEQEKKSSVANTALFLDKNSTDIYIKHYIVPFGEFIPRYMLPKLLETYLFDKLIPDPFIRGTEFKIFDTKYGKIAPSICYEIIFPDFIKKQVDLGADILVNICNPAWFKSMLIKEQLMANSVFRALENDIVIVASVNTGKSYIITQKGKIIFQSKPYIKCVNSKRI